MSFTITECKEVHRLGAKRAWKVVLFNPVVAKDLLAAITEAKDYIAKAKRFSAEEAGALAGNAKVDEKEVIIFLP